MCCATWGGRRERRDGDNVSSIFLFDLLLLLRVGQLFRACFFFFPSWRQKLRGFFFELFFFYLFSAAGLRIRVFFLAVLYTMSLALFSFPSCWGWVVLHACSLFGAVAVQGFVVCSIYAKRSANDTCVFEVCVRFTNLIL